MKTVSSMRQLVAGFIISTVCCVCNGCSTPGETIALAAGGTALAGTMPGNQLEQIYYLGVFDPYEQLPPAVYRIRVRGQASAISLMKFGSGWVHASVADSLNTDIGFDPSAGFGEGLTVKQKSSSQGPINPGRRLVLFGPEGFREAPKDHRLVIVMGSSPEDYFKAIDKTMGLLNPAARTNGQVKQELFDEQREARKEQAALETISKTFDKGESKPEGD